MTSARIPASDVPMRGSGARIGADGRRLGSATIGSVTVSTAPRPLPGLSAATSPPCRSTRCLTIARPRPSPPWARFRLESACRKRSKTWGRNSGAIPSPVSLTRTRTRAPSRATSTVTRPPRGVNFTALARRFHATCWSLSASAHVQIDASSAERARATPLLSAEKRTTSSAARTTATTSVRTTRSVQLARDDAAHVEQVVDNLGLRLGVALDDADRAPGQLGRHVRALPTEHARPAQDGGEGGAQLVAERGEELVLGPQRLLRLPPRVALPIEHPLERRLAGLASGERVVVRRRGLAERPARGEGERARHRQDEGDGPERHELPLVLHPAHEARRAPRPPPG